MNYLYVFAVIAGALLVDVVFFLAVDTLGFDLIGYVLAAAVLAYLVRTSWAIIDWYEARRERERAQADFPVARVDRDR